MEKTDGYSDNAVLCLISYSCMMGVIYIMAIEQLKNRELALISLIIINVIVGSLGLLIEEQKSNLDKICFFICLYFSASFISLVGWIKHSMYSGDENKKKGYFSFFIYSIFLSLIVIIIADASAYH